MSGRGHFCIRSCVLKDCFMALYIGQKDNIKHKDNENESR